MKQKILLVGNPRICTQVAYVMDWQNFEQVAQLTDAEKYRDYQIVVGACQKKSKKLVTVKDKTLNIIYLDDVCQQLDNEERQTPYLKQTPVVSLWRRIIDRIKSRAVGAAIIRRLKRHITLRNYHLINRLPINSLKLSEMFLKVLYSRPTNIVCDHLLRWGVIDYNENLNGCCTEWVPPFGNLGCADLSTIYNSHRARIIKLSALNHSYCFCDLSTCESAKYAPVVNQELTLTTSPIPQELVLSFDRTCNLQCTTCRSVHYVADTITQKALNVVADKILASGWLDTVPYVVMACEGEVFYSDVYQRLLKQDLKRQQIHLFTNGTLFNAAQWSVIKNKYKNITVDVSLDAATATTYRNLRGGDFNKLLGNLQMLADLRQQKAIEKLNLSFVVQRDNYQEMVEFVHLAKRLHADQVTFTRLNNRGTYKRKDYYRRSLIRKGKYVTRELYEILQHSMLSEPIVDLTAFQPYIAASAKRYGE